MPAPMSAGLRDELRRRLIASAQKICRKMRFPDDVPCGDCLYTVSVLHCDFIDVLPPEARSMPGRRLRDEIMAAAHDA